MDVLVPSTRTLSEVNCTLGNLCVSRPDTNFPACPDVDLEAGKRSQPDSVLGHVRCPGGAYPRNYDAEEGRWRSPKGAPALQGLVRNCFGAGAALPLPKPLSWHTRRPLLAAAAAEGGVQIFDFHGHVPYLGQPFNDLPAPLAPAHVLRHELQTEVSALAWRPNAGASLAAGCAHGACLWSVGAGCASGQGAGASLVWLQSPGGVPVTALAWHPRGHLLAAGSHRHAGLHVWDVATGAATCIRAGLEAVARLRWSPCGSYLLAASPTGSFRIWETGAWWSERWAPDSAVDPPAALGGRGPGTSGALVDAAWAPDSRILLLAYARQLAALHLTAEAPSLDAQVLPVSLPELAHGGAPSGEALIGAMAWDCRAQRLAVALTGSHPASGCVALYDTRVDPILSARFVGFMRVAPLRAVAREADLDWEIVEAEEADENEASGGAAARRAASVQAEPPLELAFQPGFAQGAVLSVRQGALVCTIPMYFSS